MKRDGVKGLLQTWIVVLKVFEQKMHPDKQTHFHLDRSRHFFCMLIATDVCAMHHAHAQAIW